MTIFQTPRLEKSEKQGGEEMSPLSTAAGHKVGEAEDGGSRSEEEQGGVPNKGSILCDDKNDLTFETRPFRCLCLR